MLDEMKVHQTLEYDKGLCSFLGRVSEEEILTESLKGKNPLHQTLPPTKIQSVIESVPKKLCKDGGTDLANKCTDFHNQGLNKSLETGCGILSYW